METIPLFSSCCAFHPYTLFRIEIGLRTYISMQNNKCQHHNITKYYKREIGWGVKIQLTLEGNI